MIIIMGLNNQVESDNNSQPATDNNNNNGTPHAAIVEWLDSSSVGSPSNGVTVRSDDETRLSESVFKMYGKAYELLEKTNIKYFFWKDNRNDFLKTLRRAQESWEWGAARMTQCCDRLTRTDDRLNRLQNIDNFLFEWANNTEKKAYSTLQLALKDTKLIVSVLHELEILVAADPFLPAYAWYVSFLSLLGEKFKPVGTDVVLPPERFFALIKAGQLSLDQGADHLFYALPGARKTNKKHGALSHVFQWLIIKKALTDADNSNSVNSMYYERIREGTDVYQLFIRTPLIQSLIIADNGRPYNLWDVLLDLAPQSNNGIQEDATMPEGITSFIELEDDSFGDLFPCLHGLEIVLEREYRQRNKL